MSTHQNILSEIQHNLSEISSKDILIDCNEEKIFELNFEIETNIFTVPFSKKIERIFSKSNALRKQNQIETLCLNTFQIQWKYKSEIIVTPILLFPLRVKKQNLNQNFQFEIDLQNGFINPFLLQIFQLKDEDVFKEIDLNQSGEILEKIQNYFQNISIDFSVFEKKYIGQFHPDKFHFLREINQIIEQNNFSQPLCEILGLDFNKRESLELTDKNLIQQDYSQNQVYSKIHDKNLVLIGPPGTGKSQVLTNIIGKIIYENKSALVVSEKIKALEIVENKLKKIGLQHFSLFINPNKTNGSFYKQWKKTWHFLDNHKNISTNNLQLTKNKIDALRTTLAKLEKTEFFGEISFSDFKTRISKLDLSQTKYISSTPSILEFDQQKTTLKKIENTFNNFLIFQLIKQNAFEDFYLFDKDFQIFKANFQLIKSQFEDFNIVQLKQFQLQSIKAIIYQNLEFKKYQDLIFDKKKLKQYQKIKKDYSKLELKIKALESEVIAWKVLPNKLELENLLTKSESKTFLTKYRFKKQFNKLTKFPVTDKNHLILQAISYQKTQEHFLQLKSKLIDLDIENPTQDFSQIDYLVHTLQEFNKQDFSNKQIHFLAEHSSTIKQTINFIEHYLNIDSHSNLTEIITKISTELSLLELNHNEISTLPINVYKCLKESKNTKDFEKIVFQSHWIKLQSLFPELADFSNEKLSKKLDEIIAEQSLEFSLFKQEIISKQTDKFQKYQQLLITDSRKLSDDDKILKKQLKNGKAILIKEFSKTKSHLAIQNIWKSDAKLWIEVLTPIIFANPHSVSECIPLQVNLFDFVIFDEASQILLSHAIGSMYRAKKVLIAGDDKQINPYFYFLKNKNHVSLFHQAKYYYENHALKFHYRSSHPELIAFSNQYFYKNELYTFQKDRKLKDSPIDIKFVENGVFENRCNKIEAIEVAQYICKNKHKNLGIVTFSQQQLDEIWKQISNNEKQEIEKLEEKNQLFFKTIDQVQGDECDELIISFGYGKNTEGKFNMRFGSLNNQQGLNRLNVLFSRSKEKITLFTSVKSHDFKMTTNEAIHLFRKYLQNYETHNAENTSEESTIEIKITGSSNQDIQNLLTNHEVLKSRNWKINYRL